MNPFVYLTYLFDPLNDNELSVSGLVEKNIDAIYVTPSHRPTGNPLPYVIRQELLHWAYFDSSYIIEDDYDGEFRHSARPFRHSKDWISMVWLSISGRSPKLSHLRCG